MRKLVEPYCAAIGKNPLLVQGAGGNVSWKEDDTLWVKASGTWLADAADRDIFVPVDLAALRAELQAGNFAAKPVPLPGSELRPSIETLLHALMPQKVVVHLHAIEILARLVQQDSQAQFAAALGDGGDWAWVGYHKPGAELAAAAHAALQQTPDAKLIFLQSHGVVVAGQDIAEVDRWLTDLLAALPAPILVAPTPGQPASPPDAYCAIADAELHQLSLQTALFERLQENWALYPDHVVFLGGAPCCFNSPAELAAHIAATGTSPELVFIRDNGTFTLPGFSLAKQVQLRCYYDVLVRQPAGITLGTLGTDQIAELLGWDAERYRMSIAKNTGR